MRILRAQLTAEVCGDYYRYASTVHPRDTKPMPNNTKQANPSNRLALGSGVETMFAWISALPRMPMLKEGVVIVYVTPAKVIIWFAELNVTFAFDEYLPFLLISTWPVIVATRLPGPPAGLV